MVSEESEKAATFREEVRAWLRENLPKGWGTPEYVAPEPSSIEAHELGKEWTKKLYDAGYTGFGYPKEYGGIERPEWEIAIIRQELALSGTPGGPSVITLDNVLPTIFGWGQEWQKKRFIPKILNGEEAWVQGFSEPNAGSDLANVQTTAVRDGDEWVINGQKVWNSLWHFAEFAVLVVKTDMEAPRHRNLSYFIVDCTSPGFSASPLRQMTGGVEFCEMFFDNVRIPHENLIGEQSRGWYVAVHTLSIERDAMAGRTAERGRGAGFTRGIDGIIGLAKNTRRFGKVVWEDPAFRQRLAQITIENQALRYSGARTAARLHKGVPPGNEGSIAKNFSAEMSQRQAALATEIIGAYSQLVRGSRRTLDNGQWVLSLLSSRSETIAAGTSEINRNIIAERILGLPR